MTDHPEKKPIPAVASFLDNLSDLVNAGKELLQSAPAALGEASALLPKELQAKKPTVLPAEIVLPFFQENGLWFPQSEDSAASSVKMGKYRLVDEWDRAPSAPPEPENPAD